MSELDAKVGHLPTALATYLFLLHQAGHTASDAAVAAAVADLAGADDADSAGQALVELLTERLAEGDSSELASLEGRMRAWFGEDRVSSDLGQDRWERSRNARRYHFRHNLPWLAQIVDRFPSGLGTHWVLVESVTDEVTCMDPYPWDDLDEEYVLPLVEFMVKWELAGGASVRVV